MADVPKQQVYQMWSSNGTYLGVLQGVNSKFKLIQDINTIGPASIEIKVSMKLDTPMMPVKAITTEDGLWITTEDGIGLTTEGEQPNFAVDKSKIKNGNIVQITEISPYHPNGLVVFKGRVKKWKVNFGTTDDATLRVIPLSTDMNSKLVKSGPTLIKQQLDGSNGYITEGNTTGFRLVYNYDFAAIGMTNISSISAKLSTLAAGSVDFTARLIDLGTNRNIPIQNFFPIVDNPANTVATTLPTTVSSTAPSEYSLVFPSTYYFEPGHYYTILFTSNAVAGVGASGGVYWYSSTDADANGALFNYDGSGWAFGISDRDIYFKFYGVPPYTKATVTNFEPSALLKTIIDNYISEGGVVTYTPTSIQSTGINVPSYTFQTNTVAEGLDILLSLSPQGFYYTIDPGTNILTFKRISSTADHILVFRDDIQNLDLSASIEKLKNDIYFTGGLVSGSNVFVNRKNQASITGFGNEIDRITDVNVTDASVASSVAVNYLDKVDDEAYETEVEIIDGRTDITKYDLGETIGFANFGTFPDTVIIPIVRKSRDMEVGDFSLGSLPVRQSDLIQESQEDLFALQNVANPTQPS